MLNFGSNSSSSKSQKRLSRYVIGDFTFALYHQNSRQKVLLQRNITRVLAFHEKRCQLNLTSTGSDSKSFKESRKKDEGPGEKTAERTALNGAVDGAGLTGSEISANSLANSGQAPPERRTMAARSLPSQQNVAKNERSTRRSIRGFLDKIYEDADAELTLDLSNIRKKLNFITNSLDEDERPAKRQKRDTIR